jgi:hypothetical protein
MHDKFLYFENLGCYIEPETGRFTPTAARDVRRPGKGERAGSGPARAGMGLSSHSNPAEPKLVCPSRAGQQKHCSFCAEAGRSRPKRLCKPMIIAVLTYGFAQQRFYLGKNPSQGIVAARRYKHKNIHTVNEEGQAKIHRKLKEFLNIRLVIT